MRYTVVLLRDAGETTYSVLVPALPACVTVGDTVEEALANAREAIAGHVAALHDLGEDVPDEPAETVVATVMVAVGDPAAAQPEPAPATVG
ncbi:MAG: type II toxin-antitoxin system HicB family antitoxin [Chloroflexota bacterium]|nr:type II toxin-antitoxin system HicB family antitoxin [Chloroflexota bacterium]